MLKLKSRLLFGVFFIAAAIGVLVLDRCYNLPALSIGVVTLLIAVSLSELIALCKAAGLEFWPKTAFRAGVVLAVLRTGFAPLILGKYSPQLGSAIEQCVFRGVDLAALLGILLVAGVFANHEKRNAVKKVLGTFGASVFLPITLGFIGVLRLCPGGLLVMTMLVAATKLGDVAAYFVGSLFGRHKMASITSPNKSWEGAAASLAVSIAVATVIGVLSKLPASLSALFGLVVGVSGQISDLVESRIKRDAEVKDSARLIPAFGGVLDTVDSLILAAPAAFAVYLMWIKPIVIG